MSQTAILIATLSLTIGCVGEQSSRFSRIDSGDAEENQRLDDLGIVCESTFTLAGTWTKGETEQPTETTDCWADGKWTFTATLDKAGCMPQDTFPTAFNYTVTYDLEDDVNIASYDDNASENVSLGVTSEGTKECLGGFDHFRSENVVLEWRPRKQEDGSIVGTGTFRVHTDNPF